MGWFNPPTKFTTGKSAEVDRAKKRKRQKWSGKDQWGELEQILKKICEVQMGIKYEKRKDAVLAFMGDLPALANALLDLIGHFLERVCFPSLVALFDSSAFPLWIYNSSKRSVRLCGKTGFLLIHHHKRNQINLFTEFIGKLQPISEGVKQKTQVDKILPRCD